MATSTTTVDRTELDEVISQNTKNNFSKVLGLKYFCGGNKKYAANPQLQCATSLLEWLKDTDTCTHVLQWDDAGRIQLCKHYAIGPIFGAMTNAVSEKGNDWKAVKEDLQLVYPDTKSFEIKGTKLTEMKQKPGKTLPDFFIRIRSKAGLPPRRGKTYCS